MDKGDELTVTAEEVSRLWNILSKAVEICMQLQIRRAPVYCPYGRRHSGGMNFIRAQLRNSGTCTVILREMHNKINLEAEYRSTV